MRLLACIAHGAGDLVLFYVFGVVTYLGCMALELLVLILCNGAGGFVGVVRGGRGGVLVLGMLWAF